MNDLWEDNPSLAARLAYLELQLVWESQTQFQGIPDFDGISTEDDENENENENENDATKVHA